MREATLIDLEVTFAASADRAAWRKLAAEFRPHAAESPDNESSVGFSFAALSKPVKQGEMYITVSAHPTKESDTDLHWHFQWRTVPDDDPPANLMSTSDRVGGYPAAFKRLVALWPSKKKGLDAQVTAAYVLEPSRYKRLPGNIGSSPKSVRLGSNSTTHTLHPDLRMTVWRVEPRVDNIISITTVHSRKQKNVIVEGKFSLDLTDSMCTAIDSIVWAHLEKLLGAT